MDKSYDDESEGMEVLEQSAAMGLKKPLSQAPTADIEFEPTDSNSEAFPREEFIELEKEYFKAGRLKLVMLIAVFVLLLVPIDLGRGNLILRRLFDFAHVPLFAIIAFLFISSIKWMKLSLEKEIVVTLITTTALAVSAEILQMFVGREPSIIDAANGIVGSILLLLGYILWPLRRQAIIKIGYAAIFVIVVLTCLIPTYKAYQIERRRQHSLPAIAGFEHRWELTFWEPEGKGTLIDPTFEYPTREQQSLRVKTSSGISSGTSYRAGKMNWRSYKFISFDVFNPGAPFLLMFRVDDSTSTDNLETRFTTALQLNEGINNFRIPLAFVEDGPANRKINLNSISQIVFFVRPQQESRLFYLDNIRLE